MNMHMCPAVRSFEEISQVGSLTFSHFVAQCL
jgi:hypothetical protein